MKQAQSEAYCPRKTLECDIATAIDATRASSKGEAHVPERVAEQIPRREAAPRNNRWHQMVDCEARNALQVILSGSEILLDASCRISPLDQKAMLERILASAHHLNNIIATLTKSNELICETSGEIGVPEEIHVAWSKAL